MKFRYLFHPLTADDRRWLLVMSIAFTAGLALVCCTSCAARAGWTQPDGSSGYAAASLGITERGVRQDAHSFSAAESDGAPAIRDLRLAAQTASIGGNLVRLGRTAGSILRSREVTDREALRTARDTESIRQDAAVETTRILNPAPPQP